MNLKRPLFKFCIMTKPAQCRIYGVHDEAKDKAFELELSWICDESKRQHQKVLVGYSHEEGSLDIFELEFYCTFFSSLDIQVPNELLEQAKAAAQAALEEMDAD